MYVKAVQGSPKLILDQLSASKVLNMCSGRLIVWVSSGLLLVSLVCGQDWFDSAEDSAVASAGSGRSGFSCNCGWQNKKRIVNGRETGVNEYPFMAGVIRTTTNVTFCGASILTARHALTAAHCTIHFPLEETALNVGEHDLLTDREAKSEVVPLQAILNHEGYNSTNKANDISLLVTTRPISFTLTVGPVCMPNGDLYLAYQWLKLLGWGRVADGGVQATKLQEVELRATTINECKRRYQGTAYVSFINTSYPNQQFCTFTKDRDSCKGDSGGPLLWKDASYKDRWVLAGLVSFGGGCADNQYPTVNTQISSFAPWIKRRVRETVPGISYCEKINKWDLYNPWTWFEN